MLRESSLVGQASTPSQGINQSHQSGGRTAVERPPLRLSTVNAADGLSKERPPHPAQTPRDAAFNLDGWRSTIGGQQFKSEVGAGV